MANFMLTAGGSCRMQAQSMDQSRTLSREHLRFPSRRFLAASLCSAHAGRRPSILCNAAAEPLGIKQIPYRAAGAEAGCIPAFVTVDNSSKPLFTELRIEAADYPGLLRVIAWVLNGMNVKVHNAILRTNDDGMADDVLWLTDLSGKKLGNAKAQDVADRLQDFVLDCKVEDPAAGEMDYVCGNSIVISNTAHERFTELRINDTGNKAGFLLEVASVITGVGARIHEAVIESADDSQSHVPFTGRMLKFFVTDSKRNKLDITRISSLVYTLELVMGKGNMPTVAPNMQIYVNSASGGLRAR